MTTNKVNIWDLFAGYESAHGRYDLSKQSTTDRGKIEGRAWTVREPVTEQLWEAHLAGQGTGIGIIPLRSDNTVLWACIDIDVYNLDLVALEQQIVQLKLPLVMARTKSGGAHLFLFLKEPTQASEVRPTMEAWAAALGHGGVEIFPKQTSRCEHAGDTGNWLNMPYYYAQQTLRYGIKDGQPLSLDQFVEYAIASSIDLSSGHPASSAPSNNGGLEEGPPCLQRLRDLGGFPGHRNEGMYNVGVYLRKRFPDSWEDKISSFNEAMCHPALTLSELNTIVKSIGRKKYDYRCQHPPIAAYCQRRLCQSRDYGVGQTVEGSDNPEIGNLTKYNGDPVLWFFDIGGARLMLTTKELTNQSLFREHVVDKINRFPAALPTARWGKFIDSKLQSCDVIEVPMDASPTGQFQLLVEQFTNGMAQATSKDELIHRHTPFDTGDGEVWFRSRGLLDYLNHHGFKFKSEHHVWQMLRDMGGTTKFVKVKGHGINLWVLPKSKHSDEDAPLPEFGTKEF